MLTRSPRGGCEAAPSIKDVEHPNGWRARYPRLACRVCAEGRSCALSTAPGAGLVTPERSLANLVKRNLAELTALVKTRLRRMQYRPGLLDGFLASAGPDLTPFSIT
jgi:hypothetical protein